MKINLDFETRSTVDLRKTGVYPYALSPTTDVWCLAYAIDGAEPQVWRPGQPVPDAFKSASRELELHAWNAQFERIIWSLLLVKRYGFPRLELEQFHCTAATAAAMALPRALDQAARVLGIDAQKDKEGHALMMRMAKPRKPRKGEDPNGVYWWDEEEKIQRLIQYCVQDVRVEAQIGPLLRPLSPAERRVYLLDQSINDRGVQLDLPLVRAAQRVAQRAIGEANAELLEVTGGAATAVTKPAEITAYLQEQGVDIDNVRKDTVRDLLAAGVEDDAARRALEIRSEAAKSSTAKLEAMLNAACFDGRARGLLLYHGAGTGRWSGKLVQPQNMPRPEIKGIERFIPMVQSGDYETIAAEAPPLVVVSGLLRSMLIAAPGHRLIAGDYSQIEARVTAWFAGQEDLLHLFATGGKVYEDMGAFIFGKRVEEVGKDSLERFVGKETVLGCGFQMGWQSFKENVQKKSGIVLGDEVAEQAVIGYRNKNQRIVAFWRAINQAAIDAVAEPGRVTRAGAQRAQVAFLKQGRYLWMVLPSGRPLAYCDPQVIERMTPWGEKKPAVRFMGVNSYTRQWCPQYLYGGLLTENAVQGTARDIAAAAMVRLDAAGYRPILSVHDEVLGEPPLGHGTLEEFMELMKKCPAWANGLPVAVDGWEAERYRK